MESIKAALIGWNEGPCNTTLTSVSRGGAGSGRYFPDERDGLAVAEGRLARAPDLEKEFVIKDVNQELEAGEKNREVSLP